MTNTKLKTNQKTHTKYEEKGAWLFCAAKVPGLLFSNHQFKDTSFSNLYVQIGYHKTLILLEKISAALDLL